MSNFEEDRSDLMKKYEKVTPESTGSALFVYRCAVCCLIQCVVHVTLRRRLFFDIFIQSFRCIIV